jgi:hypothetical protein
MPELSIRKNEMRDSKWKIERKSDPVTAMIRKFRSVALAEVKWCKEINKGAPADMGWVSNIMNLNIRSHLENVFCPNILILR